MAITNNIFGHWREFYHVFYSTLRQLGKFNLLEKLETDEAHRGNIKSVSEQFTQNGFKATKSIRGKF
jgi:hypothetical protein